MTARMLGALIALVLAITAASAQVPTASARSPGEVAQLVAPIALYPDPLLAQILMAATYPLEVVEAERWIGDPSHAALTGDQLTAVLAPLPWDPSVKSLVAFPQILHMMDGNLDWTERLGEAFVGDQAAVMDAVQHLRQQAQAAGTLRSTAHAVVTDQDQAVEIMPPGPDTAYVPAYDPAAAFGVWPYPDYPPDAFPDAFNGLSYDEDGLGWFGVPIILSLWDWHHWHWRDHRLGIDRDRFAALDRNHAPDGESWRHDPAHRGLVPFRDPDLRRQFPRNIPRAFARSSPARPVVASHLPVIVRPAANVSPVQRAAPAFGSFSRGTAVTGHSRPMPAPSFHATTQHAAPTGSPRGR